MLIWNRYQMNHVKTDLILIWFHNLMLATTVFCTSVHSSKVINDYYSLILPWKILQIQWIFHWIQNAYFHRIFVHWSFKNIGKWWNIVLIFGLIKLARILTLIKNMGLVYKFISLASRFYNGANYCVIKYSKFVMQNSTCHCIFYTFAYMSLGK